MRPDKASIVSPAAGRPALRGGGQIASDHVVRDVRLGQADRRPCRDAAAEPQHRDPIGSGLHLAEFVSDEQDGAPARLQLGDHRQEFADLRRSEDRRRFVQNQDAGVEGERLQDLHALALSDRQPRDRRVGIEVETIAFDQRACALAHRRGGR